MGAVKQAEEVDHDHSVDSGLQIYLISIGVVLAIFSLTILIILIYSLCKHDNKANVRKLRRAKSSINNIAIIASKIKMVNYPTIASALFYFSSCCLFIAALQRFDPMDDNNFGNDHQFVVYMLCFGACLGLAKLSIYAQFLARLYSSFKNSCLAPNKCMIIVSIILLLLLLISIIWWIILISLRYIWWKQEFTSYYNQFYFVFGSLFIFDFTLSWLVVGLFINKLFHSVLLRSRSDFFEKTERILGGDCNNININDDDDDDDDDNDNYNVLDRQKSRIQQTDSMLTDIAFASIDENDQKRLDLITRQFILSSLSIITSQLGYITIIIILILKMEWDGYNDRIQTGLYSIFGGIFYPMDVILNCIALYFNYKFAIKYYKCCCKCCHQKCKLFALRTTTTKIKTKYMEMNDYYVQL